MKYILLLLTFGITLQINAQNSCPSFEWINLPESQNENWGIGIHSDAEGNTYTTGFFSSTIQFGGFTLTATGKFDMYVVKANAQGQYLWVAQAGGNNLTSVVRGVDITLDSIGNCYVRGYFFGNVTIGNQTLSKLSGNESLFVTKLDPYGQFQWAIQTNSASGSGIYSNSLVVDKQGNSYIHGRLDGTTTFGNTTLTKSNQQYQNFLAKIDTAGEYEWAIYAGNHNLNSQLYTGAISIDDSGHLFVSGSFQHDTFYFGTEILTPGIGEHIYIAKLNAQGQLIWLTSARSIGPYNQNHMHRTDKLGNCYITGSFKDTARFSNIKLIGNEQSAHTAFVAKLNPNGQFIAATKIENGNVTNSISGGTGISISNNNSVYVTGWYIGTAIFGNTKLENEQLSGIFVAKLDQNVTNFHWALGTKNSNSFTKSHSIASDNYGYCYITGLINKNVKMDTLNIYSEKGQSFINKISDECTSSIPQTNTHFQNIKVYPNPVQGNGFGLILSEQYQNHLLEVNIYDITGRKLYNQKGKIEEINQYLSSITVNAAKGLWTVQVISHTSGKSESVRVSVQ